MQGEAFKLPKRYELIDPEHDNMLIFLIAPQVARNHLGYDRTAESRYMCRGTRHICKTWLLHRLITGTLNVVFVMVFHWSGNSFVNLYGIVLPIRLCGQRDALYILADGQVCLMRSQILL